MKNRLSHKENRESKMRVSHTITYLDSQKNLNEVKIDTQLRFLIREIRSTITDIKIQDEKNEIVGGDEIFTNK
jgi:hypothetical protein